jgi:two-component system, LytTR family, response regulator LytT
MKAVIIEDETAAVRNLQAILKEVAPDVEIIAVLDSIQKSVAWLTANQAPDLIFMDIHLADGESFLIFDKAEVEAPVIFTTAYDEYALEAFKTNGIDYLLKPINPEDITRALSKLRKFSGHDKFGFNSANETAVSEIYHRTFLIPIKDKLIPLSTSKIAYFYSKNEKVTVCTVDGLFYLMDKTLDSVSEKLDPDNFFRANRQFIVSHSAVKEISIWFGNRLSVELCVETQERIIISKARVPEFKRWLIRN